MRFEKKNSYIFRYKKTFYHNERKATCFLFSNHIFCEDFIDSVFIMLAYFFAYEKERQIVWKRAVLPSLLFYVQEVFLNGILYCSSI